MSSCVQSRRNCQHCTTQITSSPSAVSQILREMGSVLSTGKSSNSSSSSNAAVGFASLLGSEVLSEVVAFVVACEPPAGAADIAGKEGQVRVLMNQPKYLGGSRWCKKEILSAFGCVRVRNSNEIQLSSMELPNRS